MQTPSVVRLKNVIFRYLIFLSFFLPFTVSQLYAENLDAHLSSAKALYKQMLGNPDDAEQIRAQIRKEMELYASEHNVVLKSYALPFKHGHWKVTQGNITRYTHKNKNQFSWDFELVDSKENVNIEAKDKRDDPQENYSYGMPIYAVEAGKVWLHKGNKNGKGDSNILVVRHGDGSRAVYDHIRPHGFNVRKGDRVRKGELIGYAGYSGTSYPHIHFSIRNKKLGGQTVPIRFAQFYLIENDEGTSKRITKVINGVPKYGDVLAATPCEASDPSIP